MADESKVALSRKESKTVIHLMLQVADLREQLARLALMEQKAAGELKDLLSRGNEKEVTFFRDASSVIGLLHEATPVTPE